MSLVERLAARMGGRTVVVGIGNPSRGDDAAGCLVAAALGAVEWPLESVGLRVVPADEVPESFLGAILNPPPDSVILVDAVELQEAPGSVSLLELSEMAEREVYTHRPPLTLLGRVLRAEAGADVFVLGIQPGAREWDTPPSPEVRESAKVLAEVLETAALLSAVPEAPLLTSSGSAPEVTC